MGKLKYDYLSFKENAICGRYVAPEHLLHYLTRLKDEIRSRSEGTSVQGRDIVSVQFGSGDQRILMWSQMHGNESTTTKAVLDFINCMCQSSEISKAILENCTIRILPMLNPDGALAYTRFNANSIDLNRDAQDLSQPESMILRMLYDSFKPDFCFNLHDQRTIFNVGSTANPATVSFLAPAIDKERSVSECRKISMRLIAAVNADLQKSIPGQVGLYDDAFNRNCVGDTFQMLGTPTILFEAGHFPDDYQREKTRELIFHALIVATETIANHELDHYEVKDYLAIPENNKLFFDVLVKNRQFLNPGNSSEGDAGILFREVLEQKKILFKPYIERTGNLDGHYGHKVYDCSNNEDQIALKSNKALYQLIN